MANGNWVCPECNTAVLFKGLCRLCTEYDEKGHPTKPVQRIRKNYTPTTHNPQILSKGDFLNARRRKPTKKQIEAIKEQFNAQSKALHHQHEHEEEFTEIGESITDSVREAINEIKDMGYAVVNDGGEEE